MNVKVIGTLVSMAVLSIFVYFTALFHVEPLHAAELGVTISSTTDLDAFTRSIAESDENLSKVVVRDDSVEVSYREPARFLGVIPMNVYVTAEVKDGGKVSLKHPWYAFLTNSKLKTSLKARVEKIDTSSTNVESRARIIQAMHESFVDVK